MRPWDVVALRCRRRSPGRARMCVTSHQVMQGGRHLRHTRSAQWSIFDIAVSVLENHLVLVQIRRDDCLGQHPRGPTVSKYDIPASALDLEIPGTASSSHSDQTRFLAIQSSIQNMLLMFMHGTFRRLFLTISAAVLVQNAVVHDYLMMETCGRDQPYLNYGLSRLCLRDYISPPAWNHL